MKIIYADHYCIADDTWSFTRALVAAEIAKLRDTQYGSGIIEHLRSKIDWQEAVMRQALDALSDFDYDKRMAAIAALKEIPK